jgi:hypothetical protein
MAYTFTKTGSTWSFKVGSITLGLNENLPSHLEVINLLNDATNGAAYRDYMESLLTWENSVSGSALQAFRDAFNLFAVDPPAPPVEIDPNQ